MRKVSLLPRKHCPCKDRDNADRQDAKSEIRAASSGSGNQTETQNDTDSQKEIQEKGYTLPEYAFTVECDGTKSEESGQLDVRGWIKTQYIDKKTGKPLANKKYIIYLLNGDEINGSTDDSGFVLQNDLKAGKYFIDFEE